MTEAHVEGLDDDDNPSVTGLMEQTRIHFYDQSTAAASEGTMVHETGHAVHAQSPGLLQDLIGAVGWTDLTEASARRQAAKDGEADPDAFLKRVRERGSAITDQHVFTAHGDALFYLRRHGTLPGDEHIEDDDQQSAEAREFAYARSAPHELFAEYYRMLYEDPGRLHQVLIAQPRRHLRRARKSADQPARAAAELDQRSKARQWNIMRNLVNGTGRTEIAVRALVADAPEARRKELARQTATLGLPSQIRGLDLVRVFMKREELTDRIESSPARHCITPAQVDAFRRDAATLRTPRAVLDLIDPIVAKEQGLARVRQLRDADLEQRFVTQVKPLDRAVDIRRLTAALAPLPAPTARDTSDDSDSDGWSTDEDV